jgi:hypothetical protein
MAGTAKLVVAKNAAVIVFRGDTEPAMVSRVTTMLRADVGIFQVSVTPGMRADQREILVESHGQRRTFLVPAS